MIRRRLILAAAVGAVGLLAYAAGRATVEAVRTDLWPDRQCPAGLCEGTGVVQVVDFTGNTEEPCPCLVERSRRFVMAVVQQQAGTDRLLAALKEATGA